MESITFASIAIYQDPFAWPKHIVTFCMLIKHFNSITIWWFSFNTIQRFSMSFSVSSYVFIYSMSLFLPFPVAILGASGKRIIFKRLFSFRVRERYKNIFLCVFHTGIANLRQNCAGFLFSLFSAIVEWETWQIVYNWIQTTRFFFNPTAHWTWIHIESKPA